MVTTSDFARGGSFANTRWIHFWIARRVAEIEEKTADTIFRGGSDVIQYLRQSRNPCIITTGAFLPFPFHVYSDGRSPWRAERRNCARAPFPSKNRRGRDDRSQRLDARRLPENVDSPNFAACSLGNRRTATRGQLDHPCADPAAQGDSAGESTG